MTVYGLAFVFAVPLFDRATILKLVGAGAAPVWVFGFWV